MTGAALSPHAVMFASTTTTNVLLMRHRFEVIRIATQSGSTKMIDLETGRVWSIRDLVGQTMREYVSVADLHPAVSRVIDPDEIQPTPGHGFGCAVVPKLRRQSLVSELHHGAKNSSSGK